MANDNEPRMIGGLLIENLRFTVEEHGLGAALEVMQRNGAQTVLALDTLSMSQLFGTLLDIAGEANRIDPNAVPPDRAKGAFLRHPCDVAIDSDDDPEFLRVVLRAGILATGFRVRAATLRHALALHDERVAAGRARPESIN